MGATPALTRGRPPPELRPARALTLTENGSGVTAFCCAEDPAKFNSGYSGERASLELPQCSVLSDGCPLGKSGQNGGVHVRHAPLGTIGGFAIPHGLPSPWHSFSSRFAPLVAQLRPCFAKTGLWQWGHSLCARIPEVEYPMTVHGLPHLARAHNTPARVRTPPARPSLSGPRQSGFTGVSLVLGYRVGAGTSPGFAPITRGSSLRPSPCRSLHAQHERRHQPNGVFLAYSPQYAQLPLSRVLGSSLSPGPTPPSAPG